MPKSAPAMTAASEPPMRVCRGCAGALGFEGPPQKFNGGLGEAVALEGGEAGVEVGGGVELTADDEGAKDVADEVVDGAGGFGHVVGGAEGGWPRTRR